jgi:hypothetical protein
MKFLVLGIDPGERGAAALLAVDTVRKMPDGLEAVVDVMDWNAFRPLLSRANAIITEMQSASPQMGVRSAFTLGKQAGVLEGLLLALGLPGGVVPPSVWKASYGLPGGKEGKRQGMEMARQLVGSSAAERIERHDQADAVLLAWWGWCHQPMPGVH